MTAGGCILIAALLFGQQYDAGMFGEAPANSAHNKQAQAEPLQKPTAPAQPAEREASPQAAEAKVVPTGSGIPKTPPGAPIAAFWTRLPER